MAVKKAPHLINFCVEQEHVGKTILEYIAEKLPLKPDKAKRLETLINSKIPAIGKLLIHDQSIELRPETRVWPGLRFSLRRFGVGDTGEPPPIPVLYEDDAILVVNKPGGLATHPSGSYYVSTLTYALSTRYDGEDQAPCPAHRLDRETSGVVVCGKGFRNSRIVSEAFEQRQVQKTYIAICEGFASQSNFDIRTPLLPDSKVIKMKIGTTTSPNGWPAWTSCSVVQRYEDSHHQPLTLLRCILHTGRRHQLRVHLNSVGLPLVGDKLYGVDENIFLKLATSTSIAPPAFCFDPCITEDERAKLRLWRHALHAEQVSFLHPTTQQQMTIQAQLPDDMLTLLNSLLQKKT